MSTAASTIRGPMGRKRKEIDQSTYSGRVAARLRMLRERSGKTVPEMAKAVGVSSMTWYHYEANRREIPVEILPRAADVLGVSVRQMLPMD